MEPTWEVRKKVHINGTGHMIKMAAMLIYGKTFKNLLQKWESYDLETWHAASETQAVNDDPELTLTLFKTMPNFVKLLFVLTVAPDIR